MGFWDKIIKTEQSIRKHLEGAFGHGTAHTPLEVRRAILEHIESRIVIDVDGSRFPYAKIAVQLLPQKEAMRDVFESAFMQDDSLRTDVLAKIKDSGAAISEAIEISIELKSIEPDQNEAAPLFKINYYKVDPVRKRDIPEAKLIIVKGIAEQLFYVFKKERILIGRLPEVLDKEGRMVRKNDIVYQDNGEEINSTVGRIHARIWFDFEKLGFFIMDEVSRYGTQVIREGRSIDVPGGDPRGIILRHGDEIYFGQACLRFELNQT
jgi:hypothetical protein